FHNGFDLLRRVAQRLQRLSHRAVHDLHRPATDELLELHQRKVGFDAGRITVHHEPDRAGGGQHTRLCVTPAVGRTDLDTGAPLGSCKVAHGTVVLEVSTNVLIGSRVFAHHPAVGFGITLVSLVRTDSTRHFRRTTV